MGDATAVGFPLVDAVQQHCITDEQAEFYRVHGLLVIRNVLHAGELAALQDQTLALVQRAVNDRPKDPDYFYKRHEITGEQVPFRVEYVIDKTPAGKVLMGHPFVLRSIEKLLGRNFIPTWDSMVFKPAGAGAAIPWHRDDDSHWVKQGPPITNVDFYLDGSDLSNCLWGVIGSNRWSSEQAQEMIKRLNEGIDRGQFEVEGAVPLPMQPGDVIFHNVLVLHSSGPSQSALRRVIYYEFRPGEVERDLGPHRPQYIPLKQKVLLACLRERAQVEYAKGEEPYCYSPDADFAAPALADDVQLETFRYPHAEWWQKPL
jgi:phytanoyl-CoA hydroxylase